MIDKRIAQFPIMYPSELGRYGIGWGVHTTVADECKKANIKKALIVTTGLKGTGIVDEIKGILNYNGVSTETYDKVTSNPKDYQVMEAYNVFKEARCDGVVSIGGGSSHDCGKAVRIVATNDGSHITEFAAPVDISWVQVPLRYKPVTIPQVAVNTTAGTGAEISFVATVINTKLRAKQLYLVPRLIPNIGLTDPLLVRLMPQNIAAWTGFDAFSHAFEPFLCAGQAPPSLAISARVIQMFAENIREFTYNRMNHVACENMCWVEAMGNYAMTFSAGGGILHSLSHPISAVTDSHHGLTNAVLTIPAERYNEPACPDRFAEMARLMGVDTTGMTKTQAADKWFHEVERLLADLNIKTGHLSEQFGLQQKDLKHIITIISNDVTCQANPRGFHPQEWLKVLETAM